MLSGLKQLAGLFLPCQLKEKTTWDQWSGFATLIRNIQISAETN